MASPVKNQGRPLNILEVGPGTGPVTRQILRFMGPQDRFLICELNHRFITRLQQTLQKNRFYIHNRDRIDFYEGPIQGLYRQFFGEAMGNGSGPNGSGSSGSGITVSGSNGSSIQNGSPILTKNGSSHSGNGTANGAGGHGHGLNGSNGKGHHESSSRTGSIYNTWPTKNFDVIISTLPFSNFTPEMVDEVLSIFRNMLAENGTVSFVEYFMMRKVSMLFCKPQDRARIKAVDRVIKRWGKVAAAEGMVKKKLSLMNLPPALSIQWQYGDENED